MSELKRLMKKFKLMSEFKKQAKVSSDGTSVTLAGYTARLDEATSNFLCPNWLISAPSPQVTDGRPVPPPCRIVPEGGCFSRRSAIHVMAKCATADVLRKGL